MSKWPMVKLGEVVKIITGYAFNSEYFNSSKGLPLIRIRDIINGYSDTYYSGPYISNYDVVNGDLLIGMDGEFNRARWKGGPALLNQRVCKIVAIGTYLNQNYLYHLLPIILKHIEDKTPFVTVKHLSTKSIDNTIIALPPLDEQKRIAAILDKAEEIREKRRQAIEKLDQLIQATFIDMFGDPVSNPKGWPSSSLSELLTFITSGSRGWAKYYSTNGDKFLRIQNVGRNELFLDDITYVNPPNSAETYRTKVQPGDVLLSITADLGRVAVVPDNIGQAYINQHLCILRSNMIDPYYLTGFLSSKAGQNQIQSANKGGVKSGLNFNDIRSLNILIPPQYLQSEYRNAIKHINILEKKYIFASHNDDLIIDYKIY